jgi:hypothetical protein
MERNVGLMNEFGLFTNEQANKFLYTNGNVDIDFKTPIDGHIAVINELTIKDGINFDIINGKDVSHQQR